MKEWSFLCLFKWGIFSLVLPVKKSKFSNSGNTCIETISHLFLCHTQQQIYIYIIRDGFQTLKGVFIINPPCLDMVLCVSSMTMHVVIVVVHEMTCSYTERTSGDDFIPLAIETYGCLLVSIIF